MNCACAEIFPPSYDGLMLLAGYAQPIVAARWLSQELYPSYTNGLVFFIVVYNEPRPERTHGR